VVKALARRLGLGAAMLRLRRAYRFGLRAEASTWLAKRRWLKAAHLPPLSGAEGPADCFMLLNQPRLWEGVWSLHTFRRQFGPCRLVVLNDGSLTQSGVRTLERLFPGICIPEVSANDRRVDAWLEASDLPLCREWRRRFVFFRKLIDPLLLARSDRIVLLDSDMLHFRPPAAVQDWARGPDAFRFIADGARHSYCAPEPRLREICGAPLPEYFCAGYLCLPRGAVDLGRIERYLAADVFELQLRTGRFSHVAEQTLYAMEAARFGAQALPPSYATCPDPFHEAPVMGHFCGGDVSRYRLYTRGLPFVSAGAPPA
jgi:hypothetical protein